MRHGGGKAKGSQFERTICKQLSLWVSHGKQEDLFWRSAMSGGRSTVHAKKGKRLASHAGDITATDRKGHSLTRTFLIECKHYRNLQLNNFMFNGEGTLARFWQKLLFEAKAYEKEPMLIAKQNLLPVFVIVKPDTLDDLGLFDFVYFRVKSIECEIVRLDELLSLKYKPLVK